MKYLSELTPAEIYILTKENFSHQELLKVTFVDLLLKQVLKTFEVKRQPHIKQKIRIYKYIGIGQNFKNYNSKTHEKNFLSTFEKDNEIEMLFRNVVRIGYDKSGSLFSFKNEVIKTPTLEKCFSQNFLQKIFYNYSFTEYGKELKRKVEKEIQNLNNELAGLNHIENQKAIELINIIGGNIFLLQNIDYTLLKQIDKDLSEEMNKKNSTNAGTGCSGCGWSFDDYSSSFDNGCGGDSGCGGNSGCASGCSGCGGCGGD